MNTNEINKIVARLKKPKVLETLKIIDRHRSDESRYICIVDTADSKKIVVKMYQNSYNTIDQVNGWAKLAKTYKDGKLNVPCFLMFDDGKFAITEVINDVEYLIWVEEYIEDPISEDEKIRNMSPELHYDLGKYLGSMHTLSKANELKFDWNSPWVMFDKFCDEDLYDENYENVLTLYTELKKTSVDKSLLEKIWEKYNDKRNFIEIGYKNLPNGAVQGDLSVNNIILNSDYSLKGILDFNIAGNETFINHLVQESVFLSYMSDSFWNTQDELNDMTDKFTNFISGYVSEYSLSDEEINKVQTLYQIIRPFRRDKVYGTISHISKVEVDELNRRLKWMNDEMDRKIDMKMFNI